MNKTVAIVGPTAVGKSWLGMQLAASHAGEIISADSLQAYRGFDLGTAKPSLEDRQRVPHHLIDILDPTESYSAGEFARRALAALETIEERQRRSFIVGGSGLYLRALLDGISPIPATDPEVCERLRRRLSAEGLEVLRGQLEVLDPQTAARLAEGDTQRVLRALEVVLSTDRPLSSWLKENPSGQGVLQATRIGLTLPRTVLYHRIAARVEGMIQAGWVLEVENLLRRGLSPGLPAFQAIGYRQLAAHVCNETTLEEAITAIVHATCRYAKRQMTWFRKQEGITWFSIEETERCLEQVTDLVTA